MIKSISISNVATYPKTPITLEGLTPINFICGGNGTGKTTLSKIISGSRNYETCDIVWTNNTVLDVYAYNRDFRETHFFHDNETPGVFTLGSDNKELLETIDSEKKERDKIQGAINSTKAKLQDKKDEQEKIHTQFKNWCWSNIKEKFGTIFSDILQGTLNSKGKLAERVISNTNQNFEGDATVMDSLVERANTLFSEDLTTLSEISPINAIRLFDIEKNDIWNKKIIGSSDIDLSGLIQQLGINDWVNQGRNYISTNSDICPFCQKHTIDEDFRQKLEKIFDDNYKRDTQTVFNLSKEYEETTASILAQINDIIQEQTQLRFSKLDLNRIANKQNELVAQIERIKHQIQLKQTELSRTINILSCTDCISEINAIITNANTAIREHNRQVNNLKSEQKN